jgi:hypothetical protein
MDAPPDMHVNSGSIERGKKDDLCLTLVILNRKHSDGQQATSIV